MDLLPGIFRVGLDEKLVLMTGHFSDYFSGFLGQHFPSLQDDYCYDSIEVFKQVNDLNDVRVVCSENLDVLSAKLKTEIEREAKIRPVIVFGKNEDKEF